jgi:hypothetical protein
MGRAVVFSVFLVGIGVAAGVFFGTGDGPTDRGDRPERSSVLASVPARGSFGAPVAKPDDDARVAQLEQRFNRLSAQLAAEAGERHRLQAGLDVLAAQLAALREASSGSVPAVVAAPQAAPPAAAAAAPSPAAEPGATDEVSAVERALVAAGFDPATAADIKRRQDGLALDEIFLRDQATREQWLDSPRFADEMAKIESRRTSMRDDLGDDAYDRYLDSLGHPNRVRVSDVLLESPAAQAGLQAGDVVLRYGDTRIFAPNDLVTETHSGTPGENVPLEILRNGQLIEIAVPRGPLGINITGLSSRTLPPR